MIREVGILFAAFEPSADRAAAQVIDRLRRLRGDLPIWALGGPRMEEAGATLIERTSDDAVMLGGAAKRIFTHWRRVHHLHQWLADHPLHAFIPVDSPAANWSICRAVRRTQKQAKIIHLVAPQLWAWAPGRIRKLRRLTDHVLCLFPFESAWFNERSVPATFVGHPVFDRLGDPKRSDPNQTGLPDTDTRLALLPGSRDGEIEANWPIMLCAFQRLQRSHPGLYGAVAAVDQRAANRIVDLAKRNAEEPLERLSIVTASTDGVLDWCNLALVVSGTASFETAARHKPMVVLFNVRRLAWHLIGRWLIETRTFAMPNLIAQFSGEPDAVPELVPHFGDPDPVVAHLDRLIRDPDRAHEQIESLKRVTAAFSEYCFAELACRKLIQIIDTALNHLS